MSDGRYVFDTNVLASAVLFPDSVPLRALERAERTGRLLVSEDLFREFARVILRPKFDRYVDRQHRALFAKAYWRKAEHVPVTEKLAVCRDPADNIVLEVACNGGATHSVTGDADLLSLSPFRLVTIVTPAAFLEIISGGA